MKAVALGLALLALVVVVAYEREDAAAALPGTNGKIVFESERDGNFEVYSMNGDGTGQKRLTNNASHDGQPVWSPDGSKIARSIAFATEILRYT